MSFLDKIKARRAADEAAKKNEVNVENKTSEPEAKETAAPKPSFKSLLARKKKEAEQSVPVAEEITDIEEKIEENKDAEVNNTSTENIKAESVVEDKKEAVEDTSEQSVEDLVNEAKAEVANEIEAQKEEDEEKPKPAKRKRRTRAEMEAARAAEEAAKKTETVEIPSTESDTVPVNNDGEDSNTEKDKEVITPVNNEPVNVDELMGVGVNYNEHAAKILSSLEDDDWKKFKQEVTDQLREIKIAPDMNPGMMKILLTQLNDLYGMIAVPLANMRGLLEALTDKEDGLCSTIRKTSSIGKNDAERKTNAQRALTNATYMGEKFNLSYLVAATRCRYEFLVDIRARIKFMSDLCITVSSSMKLEEKLNYGAV